MPSPKRRKACSCVSPSRRYTLRPDTAPALLASNFLRQVLAYPISKYSSSSRSYPRRLPNVEYPSTYLVRLIHTAGTLKWRGSQLYVSEALIGEQVGLEPIDNDQWLLRFASVPLGVLDNRPRIAVLRPV